MSRDIEQAQERDDHESDSGRRRARKGRHAPPAPMKMWLAEPMDEAVAQSLWRLRRTRDVRHVAVMPDAHLTGDVCTGIALATEHLVYPSAVGGDIGCGYAAVRLAVSPHMLNDRSAGDLLGLWRERVFIHRRGRPLDCPWLNAAKLSCDRLEHLKHRDGRHELGTLGRGNHFLELQEDESDGGLWLMIHSGSRCMGQAILTHHLEQADGSSHGLRHLDSCSEAGRAYLHDMAWARGYAAINRLMMLRLACDAMGRVFSPAAGKADWATHIHRDHNHVHRERHGRRILLVHRKGAARARAGEPGIIPGSMAASTFHVLGRGVAGALCSSSHGAGRSMSRNKAMREVDVETFRRQVRAVYLDDRLVPGLRDESPAAYRNVEGVMRAQRELVRSIRRLTPRVSFKGV